MRLVSNKERTISYKVRRIFEPLFYKETNREDWFLFTGKSGVRVVSVQRK